VKYATLALLLLLAGLGVMHVEREPERFTPLVRLRTVEGMFITFVQPGSYPRRECNQTVAAFTQSLNKSCVNCFLESAQCHEKLEGLDRALARNEPVPFHTVEAKVFRVAVAGPPATVLQECREIAAQMARFGIVGSYCREPLKEVSALR
jgi:hypothetical protein